MFLSVCRVVSLWCGIIMVQYIFNRLLPVFLVYLSSPGNGKGLLSSIEHRPFSEDRRIEMKEHAKRMFYFGYDNYLQYAFPKDELNPIYCTGRGHDWDNPSNININDVLGDYSLTLIDSLDTLVVMGNNSEFKRAVQLLVDTVSFETCSTVQVFEVTIRVIGSLLSAHMFITDEDNLFGNLMPQGYDGELLTLAHELANKLLPAFEATNTDIPLPRVNLCSGLRNLSVNFTETCTAGAGTLTLEFGLLSKLLGDPIYENVAKNAVKALWDMRHISTGLVANSLDAVSGEWSGRMSGLGAGIDSFYEYLLKSYIVFGEDEYLVMFSEMYKSIMQHIKRGPTCYAMSSPSWYANVDYATGEQTNNWIDSLSASFAGLQVLAGDVEEAICTHALFYSIWRKYGALPERFDMRTKTPSVLFYPLRPEFAESTYLLYMATRNPFYLHVGSEILEDLEQYKSRCGYATVHNVIDKSLEDRMESFFLSETCKYLYLLFDHDNIINKMSSEYIFTTEGHVIRVNQLFRRNVNRELGFYDARRKASRSFPVAYKNQSQYTCTKISSAQSCGLPLSQSVLRHIESFVGL